TAGFEEISYAEREWQFWSDDREVDFFLSSKLGEFFDLLRADGDACSEFADGRASRRAVDFFYLRALADFPDQRVFAPAAADNEDFHSLLGTLTPKIEDGRQRTAILDSQSSIIG